MKSGDRIECMTNKGSALYKKRGKVVSTSPYLVTVLCDGMDYEFSLPREELRVLSAVELLAEVVK